MTETELFELKVSLHQKPVLFLTAKAKLKKFGFENLIFTHSLEEVEISTIPHVWWQQYSVWKNNWKLLVFKAYDSTEVATLILESLYMEKRFCELVLFDDLIIEMPLFGKEPDPMIMHHGFMFLQHQNVTTFKEVKTFVKNYPNSLTLEFLLGLKRLSLLPKYLSNE